MPTSLSIVHVRLQPATSYPHHSTSTPCQQASHPARQQHKKSASQKPDTPPSLQSAKLQDSRFQPAPGHFHSGEAGLFSQVVKACRTCCLWNPCNPPESTQIIQCSSNPVECNLNTANTMDMNKFSEQICWRH